jgi:hypothetical protein
VFGKRYRQVIRNWEATLRVSGANDTRYVTMSCVGVSVHTSLLHVGSTGLVLR